MASPVNLSRVVFGHTWQDVAEWARALDQLADLNDAEIESLVRDNAALPAAA